MLLNPGRPAPLLFAFFFGYYPVLKSLIEKIKPALLQWALKFAAFNAVLAATYRLLGDIVYDFGEIQPNTAVLHIGGSMVFALFDYGFSKAAWFYAGRVSKFIKKDR